MHSAEGGKARDDAANCGARSSMRAGWSRAGRRSGGMSERSTLAGIAIRMPQRIQRRRVKGWRMPPGAIYVGRPTMWGNRYQIGSWSNTLGRTVETVEEAIRLYREVVWSAPHMQAWIRENLRGHDLVCWCRLDEPCHADWLLELANGGAR